MNRIDNPHDKRVVLPTAYPKQIQNKNTHKQTKKIKKHLKRFCLSISNPNFFFSKINETETRKIRNKTVLAIFNFNALLCYWFLSLICYINVFVCISVFIVIIIFVVIVVITMWFLLLL